VDTHVVRRKIAAATQNILALAESVSVEVHSRSNSIAWALGSPDQLQLDPVVMIGVYVAQQHRDSVHIVDDYADLAIIEDIAERRTAAHHQLRESGALHRRDQFELAVLQVVIEQGALGIALAPIRVLVRLRINVAIDDEQILPAVVVVIEESISESDKRNAWLCDSGLIADIVEKPVPSFWKSTS